MIWAISISAALAVGVTVGWFLAVSRQRFGSTRELGLTGVDVPPQPQLDAAGERLHTAVRDLHVLMDAMPSMIGYWDKQLRNRFANRAYGAWFNADPESLRGKHMSELVENEVYLGNLPHCLAALNGAAQTFERSTPMAGGGVINSVVQYVPDVVDGAVEGFYVLVHDITEVTRSNLRMTALLRENESLLSTLDRHALVSMADARGRITYTNEKFRTVSGYSREELIGQDHRIVRSGFHDRTFWRGVWGTLAKGQSWSGEICNRTKQGAIYWVDAIIAPILGEDGRIEKYISIRTEITPTKEAQRRLTQSEAFLERVGQVAGVGGVRQEFANGVMTWTRETYRIFGVELGMAPSGELMEQLMEPKARVELERALQLARDTGVGHDLELAAATLSGAKIWIRAVGEVEFENGRPARIVGAVQDVTARRKMERLLVDAMSAADQANRAKSDFLANMSHEIRTPLNAIIGLGYLLGETALGREQRAQLSKIQFAGRALLGVVNNVLDLSKIEAGELLLENTKFDLAQLIHELGQMLAAQASAKGIQLIIDSPAVLPRYVRGDATRLRQVLTNLLNNSIKFTAEGQVELQGAVVSSDSERVRIRWEVRDTGIGIAADAISRLFAPFAQADESITRRFGGTGLGLSICRRLVHLMGGEIGVTSTPGVGSVFWIEVPLQVTEVLGSADEDVGPRALHILISQSNDSATEALPALVQALGWRPRCVKLGEELIERLSAMQSDAWPDVILIDAHLRDTDALQLIARLRGEFSHIELPPIIVAVDPARSYLKIDDLTRSTAATISAPVTSSALFNAVSSVLAKRDDRFERLMQDTNVDEVRAQWLPAVKVLVVDDSSINLEVARGLLERQGAIVETCSNGSEALDRLRRDPNQFDIVLMDVQMPVLDGNEAARCIRGELQLRRLPVIALTAGALVAERQRAFDAGMNDFITKPFELQTLIRVVRRHVERVRGSSVPVAVVGKENEQTGGEVPPFPKCIDARIARQMSGNDMALFGSLLNRVLREYSDLAQPIRCDLTDLASRQQWVMRFHKLRGSAGVIGATGVQKAAALAEQEMSSADAPESVQPALDRLTQAFVTLIDETQELRTALETPDTTLDAANVASDAIGGHDLCELRELLESHNLEALEKFASLAARLRPRLGPDRFARLHHAVENLEFRLAAEVVGESVAIPVGAETAVTAYDQ